jgi:hypothetical protein
MHHAQKDSGLALFLLAELWRIHPSIHTPNL